MIIDYIALLITWYVFYIAEKNKNQIHFHAIFKFEFVCFNYNFTVLCDTKLLDIRIKLCIEVVFHIFSLIIEQNKVSAN